MTISKRVWSPHLYLLALSTLPRFGSYSYEVRVMLEEHLTVATITRRLVQHAHNDRGYLGSAVFFGGS